MSALPYSTAVVVGAGLRISASLVRQFSRAGLKVAAAARDIAKLEGRQRNRRRHLHRGYNASAACAAR